MTHFIGFEDEQLEKAEKLGKTAKCPKCGEDVEIKKTGALHFINHCGSQWLVGIRGKNIQNVKPICSGEI